MKITQKISNYEPNEYFMIEFDSLDEFKKNYAKTKDFLLDKLPKPEPIPVCHICHNPMMKSSKGKFYCKHLTDGKIEWGNPIYPEEEPKEKHKEFLSGLENKGITYGEHYDSLKN